MVCGTDADYAEQFHDYAAAIRATLPATRLVLAGHPRAHEARFRAAGMDDYITLQSDNYATNHAYLQGLGVL